MSKQKHEIDVVLILNEVRCIYINGYRVAGSKPYVSEGGRTKTFTVSDEDMERALSTTKEVADGQR